MRRSVFCFCAILIAALPGKSQSISYAAALIPEKLRQNAYSTVRYERNELVIESPSRARLKVQRAVTILDDKARRELVFTQYTTRFVSLKSAEIAVYNAEGKQISRHKKKEMQTHAVGEGLVEDGYVTGFRVVHNEYPVTIECEYELELEGTLVLPQYVVCGPNQSVENSEFVVTVPADLGFRYKMRNMKAEPLVAHQEKNISYTWAVRNFPAFDREEGSPSMENLVPRVVTALDRFSYYGRDGNLSSWKSFGEWLHDLYRGQDELTPAQQEFFNKLVKDAMDDREKARIIYNYLQRNFRYVSIQLGIGGLQPFSAQFTDQKKYGDCKGLSNFMKAALQAVGIKSYVAAINGGYNEEPIDPAFPMNDFNHVILCVPRQKDSLWLECTSSTSEFGQLGTFTENRYALLITENGGALVKTPASEPRSNRATMTTKVQLDDDGAGLSETRFEATGEFREMLDEMLKAKREDQQEMLVLGVGFRQPDDYQFGKDEHTGHWQLNMTLEKVHEFSAGSKLFLAPRLYKIWRRKLPAAENRRYDYFFRFPYIQTDTTMFLLPEGYKPEALPPAKTIRCEFGTYKTNYWFDAEKSMLCTTAELVLSSHRVPAAKYGEIRKFSEAILEDEATRLVIRK
ncbi:MAG TPA: DUF3857 domain-containing protein [Chitinophagaceae bacterium]|nr:DUF3857 domain-containing protein [Chitinophagaceae bacterium]